MIDQARFYACLQETGVEFVTGVPDTLLNDFCSRIESDPPRGGHVIAANEGNAVALAAGYHLATGSIPLVYMQNSGLGNSLNPLVSLTNEEVYGIPLVLLIGWRGDPNTTDHAHHVKQGQLTPALLDAMDIPFRVLDDDTEKAIESGRWAVAAARSSCSPTALVAKKGVLAKTTKDAVTDGDSPYPMRRETAIRCVLQNVPRNTVFVATTGRASRELYHLREPNCEPHDMDFLNVGAMGHASSIATGIALAARDRLVVCFDGDAAAIMHLGALTTAGVLGLPNFLHILLNNGAHESVGGQPSVGFKADLTTIAASAGYRTCGKPVETEQALRNAIEDWLSGREASFVEVRVRKGIRDDLPPLKFSPVALKQELMGSLRHHPHTSDL